MNLDARKGRARLDEIGADAQSKLALNIWTRELAAELPSGPLVGEYFDNDTRRFFDPHPDALHPSHTCEVMSALDRMLP